MTRGQRVFSCSWILGSVWLFLPASAAKGSIALLGGVGGAGGSFTQNDVNLSTVGYAYSFALNWHPEFRGKLSSFSLGLAGKQAKLSYKDSGVNKRATYDLLGASLGLYLQRTDTFHIHILAQYYPSVGLTTISTHSVRLNGNNYRYSTWESFTGDPAFEGRINFGSDSITGQFNKKNRFRTGLGITYLQQQLKKESTEISTSNDETRPATTVSSAVVEHSFVMFTVEFFMGLAF